LRLRATCHAWRTNKEAASPYGEAALNSNVRPSMHEQGDQDDDRDWHTEE
jgi:hypothetical protein